MNKSLRRLCRGSLLLLLTGVGSSALAALDAHTLQRIRALHRDAVQVVSEAYYPRERIDEAFRQRMVATEEALAGAKTLDDACLMIADAFLAFDPSVRLHVFGRELAADYGWNWRIVGDEALVCHVDRESAAARSGLRVGDRVLSINGTPLNRQTYRLLGYSLDAIAPQPGLRIDVRRPGEQVHTVVLAAKVDLARLGPAAGKNNQPSGYRAFDPKRLKEYRDVRAHLQTRGRVVVWRAAHLAQGLSGVKRALAGLDQTEGLIIDLRGQFVFRHDTVLAVLGRLLGDEIAVARIEQAGFDQTLRTASAKGFSGEVVVLVDAGTGGYAEVLARTIQLQRRGRVIGDRTAGWVRNEALARFRWERVQGNTVMVARTTSLPNGGSTITYTPVKNPDFQRSEIDRVDLATFPHDPVAFHNARWVRLPVGRVVLADGTDLHGVGVTPDVTLLPTGEDLAGRRDVVLARALALLGQTVTPEDAYQLFRNDWDDDEIILDQTALY